VTITITSFGFLHGAPPQAHLLLDLQAHFRDPHVDPELRTLTAEDRRVQEAVLATPGITEVIAAAAGVVRAFLAGPTSGPVHVAVGCAGGRHRAATVADALATALTDSGVAAQVAHRDLAKPVVNRDGRHDRVDRAEKAFRRSR
jgi:RNase adaptor protein for sRNA GlmZ degradation